MPGAQPPGTEASRRPRAASYRRVVAAVAGEPSGDLRRDARAPRDRRRTVRRDRRAGRGRRRRRPASAAAAGRSRRRDRRAWRTCPSTSGRSVERRATRTGRPTIEASSWTPPESLTRNAHADSSARKSRKPSGSIDPHRPATELDARASRRGHGVRGWTVRTTGERDGRELVDDRGRAGRASSTFSCRWNVASTNPSATTPRRASTAAVVAASGRVASGRRRRRCCRSRRRCRRSHPSASRWARAVSVGAQSRSARWSTTTRLRSSGIARS